MSWGYKILFVYLAFVAGILLMVFRASSQKFDLVTNDYYARELKYQDKIEEMGRVAALSSPVQYELKGHEMLIGFPKEFAGKKITGEAVLYRPSDEGKDIKKNFSIQDETLVIPVPAGAKGLYELHLSWEEGGVAYYFEKKIII
ncbi:MAG TPA: FixH family protein [Ferruginibacter sp.]|nr:hypothetical protein [Chitinophagaceae bacterium]HRI25472.1 FixH family protein [Ferruginibacter sp.]